MAKKQSRTSSHPYILRAIKQEVSQKGGDRKGMPKSSEWKALPESRSGETALWRCLLGRRLLSSYFAVTSWLLSAFSAVPRPHIIASIRLAPCLTRFLFGSARTLLPNTSSGSGDTGPEDNGIPSSIEKCKYSFSL
jgi:hypothetical protein